MTAVTNGKPHPTTVDTHVPQREAQLASIDVGRRARVIVLRGVIRDTAVDELRDRLSAALEAGIREVVLDLRDVESVAPPVHELVSAASIAFADRGGVLLAWSRKRSGGEPVYLITELDDRALAELTPATRSAGGRS